MVRVLPAAGYGVHGYGYGVRKTDPRYTRAEPYAACQSFSPKTDHHILDESLLLVPNSDHQLIEPGLRVRGV